MAYLPRRLLAIDNRRIVVREFDNASSMGIALVAVMSQAAKNSSLSAVHVLLTYGSKNLQHIDIVHHKLQTGKHIFNKVQSNNQLITV